jgi:hypothetical protein
MLTITDQRNSGTDIPTHLSSDGIVIKREVDCRSRLGDLDMLMEVRGSSQDD